MGWSFPRAPDSLACLSLAVGVAVLRTVRECGLEEAQLKWPNDLVIDGRKLAGILVDVQGESGGPLHAVIGIGMNYCLDEQAEEAIIAAGGLEPSSLTASGAVVCGRNECVARLINQLVHVLRQFEAEGFGSLAAEWSEADYLRGKEIVVASGAQRTTGAAVGISAEGQLLVEVAGKVVALVSGDVSVRTVA